MKQCSCLTVAAFVLFCMSGWLGLCVNSDPRKFGELEQRFLSPRPNLPSMRMLGNRRDMQLYANTWDAYLSDRVFERSAYITTYLKLGLMLSPAVQNSPYVEGKDGWLFWGNGHHSRDMLDYTRNVHPATEAQINAKCEYLEKLYTDAKEAGVYFAVLVAPNKSSIYPEYLPDWLVIKDSRRFADRVYERLKLKGFPIVFPKMGLEQAKSKGQLYFKDDSHWNEIAAFTAFSEIMELFSAQGEVLQFIDPITLSLQCREKTWEGDIIRAGNLDRARIDNREWFYNYPEKEVLKHVKTQTEKGAYEKEVTIAENPAPLNPQHLLIIGDSFSNFFFDCACVSFARVTSIHISTLKQADLKDVLQRIHPDYVVFENVERFFWKP